MPDAPHITSAEIVPLHARMTDAQYEAERARLRELYGESSVEAAAKRDQALAVLFHRSGWTQDELATKEGKSQSWIQYRLRFGRFLTFTTSVVKPESLPKNLTEGRFRSFWERTEGDERHRFREIAKLMQAEVAVVAPRRPGIGKAIKERFADGKWHAQKVIAERIGTDQGHVNETLAGIRKNQTYNCKAEHKTIGTEHHWRIFKLDKAIGSNEIAEKLAPIIKGLEEQGKRNMVTMDPMAVAVLAAQLRKLLDAWTE